MKEKLNKFVDYFVHPRLKVENSVYEKSRIYVLAFLIIFGFSITYVSFYLANGDYLSIKAFHNYLKFCKTRHKEITTHQSGNNCVIIFRAALL